MKRKPPHDIHKRPRKHPLHEDHRSPRTVTIELRKFVNFLFILQGTDFAVPELRPFYADECA